MIKAILNTNRGEVLILGLSGENMTRLMAKEPIFLNVRDLAQQLGIDHIPDNILIVGGRTEENIKTELEQYFGPAPKEKRYIYGE